VNIGFSGTREGMTADQQYKVSRFLLFFLPDYAGTWWTVQYAWRAHVPTLLVTP